MEIARVPKVRVTNEQYAWYDGILPLRYKFYSKVDGKYFLRFGGNALIPESFDAIKCDEDIRHKGKAAFDKTFDKIGVTK